jgi:hypothetical protein
MKRAIAVCAVALICLSALAVAAPDNPKDLSISGTISRVDTAGKSMVVKDSAGKETTVYWTDSTSINGGELREGTPVKVSVTEKDGKTWANSIEVAQKPAY